MQPFEKESIKLLRSHIPIGISEAVVLLRKHNFAIDLSITEWKENSIKAFASNNSITEEEARNLLTANEWREENALQVLKEKTLSLTERTLQSSHNLETVLSRISRLIIENNPWLIQDIPIVSQDKLSKLNLYQGKFYTLWNWLEYCLYCEDFEVALYVEHIQMVISILNELELKEHAETIANALARKQIFHDKYGNLEDFKKDHSIYTKFSNALAIDPVFSKYEAHFRLNLEPLYKTLVVFIKEHKEDFPK